MSHKLISIHAADPPRITVHPQELKDAIPGKCITLTVQATGTAPLSYQWKLQCGEGTFLYVTLPWLYFTLLHSTLLYQGCTWLHIILPWFCLTLLDSTLYGSTLLYITLPWLYLTLLDSTLLDLPYLYLILLYITLPWVYLTLHYFTMALHDSTLLYHGSTSLYFSLHYSTIPLLHSSLL